MKPFLRQQLARYADRLGELEFLLSREDIMQDMKQFLALSREHTEVGAVASRWARYQQREADLAAGQEMLAGSADDADMLAMAQEEIDGATAECAAPSDSVTEYGVAVGGGDRASANTSVGTIMGW